jgi:hypothetical protein
MGAHAINSFFKIIHPECNQFCNKYTRLSSSLQTKGTSLALTTTTGDSTLSHNNDFVSKATTKSIEHCYPQMEQTLRNVTILNKNWGKDVFEQWQQS